MPVPGCPPRMLPPKKPPWPSRTPQGGHAGKSAPVAPPPPEWLCSHPPQIALAAGCVEMKFVTMEWNRLAKEFYLRLGAHDTTESEELHCMELGRGALERLVQRGQQSGSANPCNGQQPQA